MGTLTLDLSGFRRLARIMSLQKGKKTSAHVCVMLRLTFINHDIYVFTSSYGCYSAEPPPTTNFRRGLFAAFLPHSCRIPTDFLLPSLPMPPTLGMSFSDGKNPWSLLSREPFRACGYLRRHLK